MKISLFDNIKNLPNKFWLLQSIQMIERLTYAALVLQMAVYISQKDLVGGLGFEHTDKGTIFFFWALIQNLTPVFLGAYADKYGRKSTLVVAVCIAAVGYFLAGFQNEFYPFLFSVMLLGFGLGLYRPALYGLIASNVDEKTSSIAWGVNVMLINVAVFFSPPLAKYLESISWQYFFMGLGLILLVSIIPILFLDDRKSIELEKHNVFKDSMIALFKPDVIYVVLILSGFMMIYMQFYETLPNFIYDWIDTSAVISAFNLPDFMTMQTVMGKMIDFKWLYNINSGFIILAVVYVNWKIAGLRTTNALLIGIITASVGLVVSGASQMGSIAIIGMLIYTLGEMITNPQFAKYMSNLAPNNQKSAYMGFINLSLAIGLAGGSLIGGYLYKHFGEKSGLAIRYLQEKYSLVDGVDHSNSISKLSELSGLSISDVTDLLWNTYNPQYLWLVFIGIGFISAILLWIYSNKSKMKNEFEVS